MNFKEALAKRMIFFDGAMGTALQSQGLKGGEAPESWNTTRSELLIKLHGEYLSAGCDVITANTFGANPLKAEGFDCAETVRAAIDNAKAAIEQSGKDACCALDIGPTGRLLEPNGDLSFEDAVKAFALPIRAGAASGADLIIIETFTDPYEIKAAILAAKENCDLPIIASFSPDRDGKLLTGGGFDVMTTLLEGLGVDGISLNCGFGPDVMLGFARELSKQSSLPLLIMPNAGLPRMDKDGAAYFDVTPDGFAAQMAQISRISGVCMLGGCCGTTPEHLKKMVELCRDIEPSVSAEKKRARICSYAKSVELGGSNTVVIGERINPTGKKDLQSALRAGDWEYIALQGISQRDDGADILDLNCGLPGIDESKAMRTAVKVLQSALSLPLQLDSASPAALEAGLREYNGIALINSVNGKKSSLEQVLPLAKKYGGMLVCLTLDEEGIPETPEARLAVAKKIVDRAAEYGISPRRLLIDPLCMAVSADINAARVTLDTLRLIKRELGLGTILGVSNVSFGLPKREAVSAAFFAQALLAGLDAAIINPGSQAMRTVLLTHRLLSAQDERCADYIAAMSGLEEQSTYENKELTLREAVLRGLEGQAYALAQKELDNTEPNELIGGQLIPALGEVGEKFAQGTLFLPQLMQSAKAAQEVSRAVKERLEQSGGKPESRGRIVLATVEGDIHDIGKNIVRVMLENYGFDVLDLGRNVSAKNVLEAVLIEDIRLVGLSALMTTTVPAMARTVALLKESVPEVRVLVGGAVLSERTASGMGADGYAPDAMGAVKLVEDYSH